MNTNNKLPVQSEMNLTVVTQKEIDGIDMGVLSNGAPYLSARGLARLCGTAPSVIITLSSDWETEKLKPRGKTVTRILQDHGNNAESLFIKTKIEGKVTHAFPDDVCMAILEYYAFEAQTTSTQAQQRFRLLARKGLRDFIYNQLGYDPNNLVPDSWKKFHDRMLLNVVPNGFFNVFKEMSDIILSVIREGLIVDEKTIPDISVGISWAKHWKDNNLTDKYGDICKYPHVYPDYFPQAKNGEVYVNIYPLEALGEFRKWFQDVYLPEKFPNYLKGKIKKGDLPPSSLQVMLEAVGVNSLEGPK